MQFDTIHAIVKDLPCIGSEEALKLYNLVLENRVQNALEIGIHHGKSSCYLAAALQETGGTLVSIDVPQCLKLQPNVVSLGQQTGLGDRMDLRISGKGSSWELRNLLKSSLDDKGIVRPIFDLCFIDGHHGWEYVALDFLLARKLLKPGGWLVFDDVDWRYSTSPSLKDAPLTQTLPADYRENAHVRDVLQLCLAQEVDFATPTFWKSWALTRRLG